ncbi:unnamed protein product [Auanema sp. JU1783]|nr:unnamed protein product [Auanema sp. JU1783]
MVNSAKDYFAVTILFVINLLNYVDRETVAGVLDDVQHYYDINDTLAGLIQTVFLVFFVIASPICGYLGDRYNRKWVICVGMSIWVAAVIGSSVIPSNMFWLFLLLRGIVGVGEASYSNVSPSMICDMFTGQIRNRIYMVYYLAVPCGSGLGYMVGSNISSLTGHWQWGVRCTAIAGLIGIAILAFLIPEPERGASDKEDEEKELIIEPLEPSSIWQDLYSICTNVTFINCTIAYTSLVFVAGTMLWWTPTAAEHRLAWERNLTSTHKLSDKDKDKINMLFGIITLASGIIGVVSGTFLSWALQEGKLGLGRFKTDRAPPIICSIGATLALPLMFITILMNDDSAVALWILSFFSITFLCFNWGLNVDIVMSVVVPWRRSTAFSWFMLSSHLLGDGPGPYIIGAISDAIRTDDTPLAHYKSLVAAFSSLLGLLVASSVMYAVTALTLLKDKEKVNEEILRNSKQQ